MQTERKTEILDAFIHLVNRFGFSKTTMQDVAKEVGISVGVIYKDFTNKEDLIMAYLLKTGNEFFFSVRHHFEQVNDPVRLLNTYMDNFIRAVCEYADKGLGFKQFLRDDEGLRFLRDNKAAFEEQIIKDLAEIMQRGVDEHIFEIEDVRKTASLYFNAFGSYFEGIVMNDDPQKRDEFVKLAKDMEYFLLKALVNN